MKVQILKPFEDWEALYVDGKLACEGHRLDTYQIVLALTGEMPEEVVIEEHGDEENENNDTFYNGKVVFINRNGCPMDWPL